MSNQTGRSIRAQLMWLSLIIVTVSVALSLAGTLYITLRTERKTLDQNLLNSASILSQVPLVREALLGEVPADELADFLDAATARTSDIDLILVGDTESVLRYAPDRSFIGSRYTGSAQTRALAGAEPYTFDDSGPMGSDHSAYAPIRDESGAVIGFMAVGLYLRSLTHVALTTALRLAAIGALAAAVGALLALRTGVSRGVFTNEAGLGSSAFAYQGVEGRSPEELGCLGIFQVFVDTLVMCTVTGLCILCCRSPVLEGGQLAFYAFESALGPWGGRVASLCTALFALATLVAWCCWGREGLFYLAGGRGRTPYALAAGAAAALGCLLPLGTVFQLGDACNGLMALPNVAALFLLRREAAGVSRRGGEGAFQGEARKKVLGKVP